MNDRNQRHFAFARLLGSAVVSQAVLSAASFCVGLILIRRSSDFEYGAYILASNAILLMASLQNAFFGPPLALHLSRLAHQGRSELVGGLHQAQQRLAVIFCSAVLVIALGLWSAGMLDAHTGPLLPVTVVAGLAILHREFFRSVLLAYRRSHEVLRTDFCYVALLVTGVWVATLTVAPAIGAVLALGLAAATSWLLLSRALRRHEAWTTSGANGLLREIAPLGGWSTAGATIHWSFSQGYIYLVAATLDVHAVAAIAATRLLLMPVNLLSTGIGSLMLPLASGWLHRHGPALLFRRLCLFALGLTVVTLCYFSALWWQRDWVFAVVLKKQFEQRDTLLMLWGVLFLVMVARDQLGYLLAAQARFRVLSLITLVSAFVSLSISYWAMTSLGVVGALVGMLVGEVISLTGILILSFRRAEPLAAVLA